MTERECAVLPFDSNDYRRRVLAAVHARGGPEQSDPFEIYDIPLEEASRLSDAHVRERIATVWAFWQRSRDHPRYRGVIIALLGLHEELSAALATATSRAELAARVSAARAARDGERFAELDAAVSRLVARFGGLPEDKLAGLRSLAAARGVDEATFNLRVRRYRVLPAGAPERADATPARRVVPAEVLRQLRADLDELGRIAGMTPPRSLFDLLGVAPGASREEIRAVRDAAAARNRERRPDRRRALLDDLLTAARALLVEGDPAAYLDALVEPVTAALRPKVATAVLIEDRLLADAAAGFVAEAEAEGLDPGRARAVVAALAREHGVEAPVVATAPRPPGGSPAGSPAGTPAGTVFGGGAGPSADGGTGGGGGSVPPGGYPPSRPEPARAADWQGALSRARAALRAGRPIEASDEISRAREIAGETLPPIRALGDEVERAIRAAGERWRAIVGELTANRQHAALRLADELAGTGSDVPGPDGRVLAEVRAAAQARCARADALVARARTTLGPERIRLAREALAAAADHAEALALVGAGGPAGTDGPAGGTAGSTADGEVSGPETIEPPTGLSARWDGASVVISWRPTVTPGEVRYRIRRITPDGNARAVGVTSATDIEDGGVSRGSSIPEYEVIAGIGGVWSTPARWPAPAPPAPTVPPEPAELTDTSVLPRPVPVPVPPPATPPATATAGPAGSPPAARPAGTPAVAVPPPGPRTAADDLGPATGLRLVEGRLCWDWPLGCTEMMVSVRADLPPAGAQELGSTTRKVTNTRYDIDGGFALPAVRPLHVALFACVRVAGALVIAGTAAGRCLVDAGGTLTVVGTDTEAGAEVTGADVAGTDVTRAEVTRADVAGAGGT